MIEKTRLRRTKNFSASFYIFEWHHYTHGETLPGHSEVKGWALLTCQDHSLGWGKVVNGTIKNFYPKGLRN